ncbi:avidin/streptavidin family protein [Nibrella saemangeumensis]|uniref:Avidin/streptavidin family protein n=1 Tax=Nibrella saemangeumensis TaxID=1084526 RepID=A0ABP8N0U3_9BACT
MLQAFLRKSTTVDAPVPSVNFKGVWVNELGSKMTLDVTDGGNVSGTYVTNVGSPGKTEEFPLTGFASGDLIAFTVNFGKYGSLTSWSGQHTETENGAVIKTMWLLAENVPDQNEPKNLWGAVLTGADEFTR